MGRTITLLKWACHIIVKGRDHVIQQYEGHDKKIMSRAETMSFNNMKGTTRALCRGRDHVIQQCEGHDKSILSRAD